MAPHGQPGKREPLNEDTWIAGDRIRVDGETSQKGPMFVEWEAPEQLTRPSLIVLMHGGGFQSTEWFDTPDGRPGWAERSIEAGYTVLAVDRPGHVRSLLHTAIMGGMSPPSPMSMDTISTFWKRDVQSRRSGT
jgi:pimeloyl-ACP methyl ester carboxylesterase